MQKVAGVMSGEMATTNPATQVNGKNVGDVMEELEGVWWLNSYIASCWRECAAENAPALHPLPASHVHIVSRFN